MKRQRGQIALYGAIGAGVVIVALGIALKIQSSRLETAQTETAAAKAAVAQWMGVAKDCSDSVEKAAKASKEASVRAQEALKRARATGIASKNELARLKAELGKPGDCSAAVQQVKQGLK